MDGVQATQAVLEASGWMAHLWVQDGLEQKLPSRWRETVLRAGVGDWVGGPTRLRLTLVEESGVGREWESETLAVELDLGVGEG